MKFGVDREARRLSLPLNAIETLSKRVDEGINRSSGARATPVARLQTPRDGDPPWSVHMTAIRGRPTRHTLRRDQGVQTTGMPSRALAEFELHCRHHRRRGYSFGSIPS